MVIVRKEVDRDFAAVRDLNIHVFPTDSESRLVDALRESESCISLVAEENGLIVGHILFSPVTINEAIDCDEMLERAEQQHADLCLYGLAPMAVQITQQNRGIGSQLVVAGLIECERLAADAVVVLGHPEYYPRFGFSASIEFGLDSVYDVPAEVFMVKELVSGSLKRVSGRVHYANAFNGV